MARLFDMDPSFPRRCLLPLNHHHHRLHHHHRSIPTHTIITAFSDIITCAWFLISSPVPDLIRQFPIGSMSMETLLHKVTRHMETVRTFGRTTQNLPEP